jgi:hypothetical protein
MHGWRAVFISHGVLSGLRPLTAAKQTKRERRCMVLLIGIKLGDQFPAVQSCPHQRKIFFKKKGVLCAVLLLGSLMSVQFSQKYVSIIKNYSKNCRKMTKNDKKIQKND